MIVDWLARKYGYVPKREAVSQDLRADLPVAPPSAKKTINWPAVGDQSRPKLHPKVKVKDLTLATLVKVATPPPGVLPAGTELPAPVINGIKFAMDADPGQFQTWYGQSYGSYAFIEGYTFLGYPYLAQLSQITEYRLVSGTLAEEVTRKWITVKSRQDETEKQKHNGSLPEGYESKAERIQELNDEMERLGVKAAFRTLVEQDGYFGRSHLYIDTGQTEERDELITDIGDGDEVSEQKIQKGSLRALKTVEAVWTYPNIYNSYDPLSDKWYRPDIWYVMGKQIHRSRLLTMVARPVPDLYKPAFSFGGLSLSQMVKPYVDNWLQTRQSVNDIIHSFSIMVLLTDMASFLQDGSTAQLTHRLNMFTNYRDNSGVFALSKTEEDFKNVAAPLGTLDHLQAQAQEHICSAAQQPLVKYTGISPSGLNASGETELKVYDDRIHAFQESVVDKPLGIVFKMIQISMWGKVDKDLYYEFNPLREMTEKEKSEIEKNEADADSTRIEAGVLDPLDARIAIAKKPDGRYSGINVNEVPQITEPLPGNIKERVDEDEDEAETVDKPEKEAA